MIVQEIDSIIDTKGNAVENKHQSVPFQNYIGNFDFILFRIPFFILNLIESLQLEYNQAIVQHGNSNEYYTNQYVSSQSIESLCLNLFMKTKQSNYKVFH